MDPTVRDWLLDSDPSIRWQVMRDLLDEPGEVVAAERAKVATEGWGARLLALQGADGRWAGRPWSHDWTDTFHVLELLRRFGLDPESEPARRAVGLVIEHVTWRDPDFESPWADNRFFDGEVEPCINGNVVATGSYFGVDMAPLVDRLLGERLPDGGWNCEVENGATASSFGTTINVLEGLLEHERAVGGSAEVRAARQRGEAYMLERRLFRRKSTGEVIDARGPEIRSRPGITTTSCADSTTCATPKWSPTTARRSRSWRVIEVPTAGGHSRTSTPAKPISRWTTARASPAAGIRCARCGCSPAGHDRSPRWPMSTSTRRWRTPMPSSAYRVRQGRLFQDRRPQPGPGGRALGLPRHPVLPDRRVDAVRRVAAGSYAGTEPSNFQIPTSDGKLRPGASSRHPDLRAGRRASDADRVRLRWRR